MDYVASADEVGLAETALRAGLPVMLVGPTGCGKTRMVEHLAQLLERPLRVVVGNDDTTTADLLGRYLVRDGDIEWHDGPVTTAVRRGELCYLDEVVEIRSEAIASLHPLADHRRSVYLDRTGEEVTAAPGFGLICSYNPARMAGFRELRSAFTQRFVTLSVDYLPPEREVEVLVGETQVGREQAERLVHLGTSLRHALREHATDPPSTRMLVYAASLLRQGLDEERAVEACLVGPLSAGRASDAQMVREIAAAAR
ncbi:MAG: CbbQ/NirQ/NorQ/GpvN family protein [Solirubrobacteraceae bacterium]